MIWTINLFLAFSVVFIKVSVCQESQKLIIKSYDSPYCIVINKNISVQPCTWKSKNTTAPSPIRLSQQFVTIHSLDADQSSSEKLDKIPSTKTNLTFPKSPRYMIRVRHALCLTALDKTIGLGKCQFKRSRFLIRPAAGANGRTTPLNGFSIEDQNGECISFEGNGPRLIKRRCQFATNNQTHDGKVIQHSLNNNISLHQLWIFCTEDDLCRMTSPIPTRSITNHSPHIMNKSNSTISDFTTSEPQTSTLSSPQSTLIDQTNLQSTTSTTVSLTSPTNDSTELASSGCTSCIQIGTARKLQGVLVSFLLCFVFMNQVTIY